MLAAKIDALDLVAYEQMLADELAVDRKDIYETGVAAPQSLAGALQVRPKQVLERLNMSKADLVAAVVAGRIVRPAKLGRGRVAWRSDEVDAVHR